MTKAEKVANRLLGKCQCGEDLRGWQTHGCSCPLCTKMRDSFMCGRCATDWYEKRAERRRKSKI
jgi:hypothetical protein